MTAPERTALAVRNLSKTFPGTRALDGVSLDLPAGRVTGLVGHNGSGKSTLIKVLAGYHDADPGGEVFVGGSALERLSAGAAAAAGMRFVHQDLGLVGSLSVIDNLALTLGYRTGRLGRVKQRLEIERSERDIGMLGCSFDVRRRVDDLAPSERTVVAVARALEGWEMGAVHVLVLDEPTASLPREEALRLFEVVRAVRNRGVAVLFVSHHLDEILSLADQVVVMRNGRVVRTEGTASLDHDRLVSLIVGREIAHSGAARTARESPAAADRVLSVDGLGAEFLRDVSFGVSQGEILGVCGLTGSGREELAGCVFGVRPRTGLVKVGGRGLAPGRLDQAVQLGMGFVPADRMADALVPRMSVRANLSLPGIAGFVRRCRLDNGAEREAVDRWLRKTRVASDARERPIFQLSGGNQQKVLLARWLRCRPDVLVLDEPTQGVDVGARQDIHALIDAAAAEGAAVLICSTDSEELERLCDRALVLTRGRIGAELIGIDLRADVIDRHCLERGAQEE